MFCRNKYVEKLIYIYEEIFFVYFYSCISRIILSGDSDIGYKVDNNLNLNDGLLLHFISRYPKSRHAISRANETLELHR